MPTNLHRNIDEAGSASPPCNIEGLWLAVTNEPRVKAGGAHLSKTTKGGAAEFIREFAKSKMGQPPRDIMKELKLGPEAREAVHEALSEGAQMAGRKLTYQEGVAAVKAALGLL